MGGDIRRDCERHGALIESRSTTVVAHSRPARPHVSMVSPVEIAIARRFARMHVLDVYTSHARQRELETPPTQQERARALALPLPWAVVWFGNTLCCHNFFMQTDFVDMFLVPAELTRAPPPKSTAVASRSTTSTRDLRRACPRQRWSP